MESDVIHLFTLQGLWCNDYNVDGEGVLYTWTCKYSNGGCSHFNINLIDNFIDSSLYA